jgi:hypothetical protein
MRPCAFRVRIAVMPAAVRLLVTARTLGVVKSIAFGSV